MNSTIIFFCHSQQYFAVHILDWTGGPAVQKLSSLIELHKLPTGDSWVLWSLHLTGRETYYVLFRSTVNPINLSSWGRKNSQRQIISAYNNLPTTQKSAGLFQTLEDKCFFYATCLMVSLQWNSKFRANNLVHSKKRWDENLTENSRQTRQRLQNLIKVQSALDRRYPNADSTKILQSVS